MKYRKHPYLLILIFAMACIACGDHTTDKQQDASAAAESQAQEIRIDSALDRYAHLISGMGNLSDSDYKKFSVAVNSDWAEVEKTKLIPIAALADTAFTDIRDTAMLVYPFAGGDFLYADAFFPDANRIMMIGLEPAGTVFNPDSMADAKMNQYYYALHQSLFFSNSLGFFRTHSMEKELNSKLLNGTVHPILFYMARMGYHICDLSKAGINDSGTMIIGPESDTLTIKGIQIQYTDSSSSHLKTLWYFTFDLSDTGMKKNPGMDKWLRNAPEHHTFLKAASYLLHKEEFSNIRGIILSGSGDILQDDSGLPYRFIKGGDWDVRLYGTYTRTIKLFSNRYQPSLDSAYRVSSRIKDPGFKIGYNTKFNETNLILAVKVKKSKNT